MEAKDLKGGTGEVSLAFVSFPIFIGKCWSFNEKVARLNILGVFCAQPASITLVSMVGFESPPLMLMLLIMVGFG